MAVYQLLYFFFFPLLEAVMFRLWVLKAPCKSLTYKALSFYNRIQDQRLQSVIRENKGIGLFESVGLFTILFEHHSLNYYFPETAFIWTYSTKIFTTHCFDIAVNRSFANSDIIGQVSSRYVRIFNHQFKYLDFISC